MLELERALHDTQSQVASLTGELEAARKRSDDVGAVLAAAHAAQQELTAANESLRAERDAALAADKAAASDAAARVQQLEQERQELQSAVDAVKEELVNAQSALQTERSRAGESAGQLERQAALHQELVAGLQAQLTAALKSSEQAESAAKQQTYALAAAYRRADAAEAEARDARDQLAKMRQEVEAASAAAAHEVVAATEAVQHSETARGDAERRLAEAVRARDALQSQLEALMVAAAQEGGGPLPAAPPGEGLLEALEAALKDREYLEGRVALLMSDVGRLTRERNLARSDVDALRAEVSLVCGGCCVEGCGRDALVRFSASFS